MSGMMKLMAFKKAARPFLRCRRITEPERLQHLIERLDTIAGSRLSKGTSAVMVRTFCCSSCRPYAMQATRLRRWGKTPQPIIIAICCTIQMPVSFLLGLYTTTYGFEER